MGLLHVVVYLLAVVNFYCTAEDAAANTETEERVYSMKKCSGSGCPYTASWLAHVNLYRRIPWWLDSTKMEAASFNIFDRAKLKFQVSDPDAYYVHHMSMFEHLIHKKYGFAEAKNKTLIMSRAAFSGECDNLVISKSKDYVALIPFYGGLPPGVTKDLAVKSIGQGNSLVDSFTKGLQTMATVCSCLKYYGHVIIGVARDEDRILVNDMLHQKQSAEVRHHVNVVQFQMNKPAHLPFHLLAWGQQYVRVYNCHAFYMDRPITTAAGTGAVTEGVKSGRFLTTTESATPPTPPNAAVVSENKGENRDNNGTQSVPVHRGGATQAQIDYFDANKVNKLDYNRLPKKDVFEICAPGAIIASIGGPVKVVYLKKFDLGRHKVHRGSAGNNTTGGAGAGFSGGPSGGASGHPSPNDARNGTERHLYPAIKYVYFTESDQVVRYDSMATLRALTAASNETTFFVGKRREKNRDSEPADYMGSLNIWRECGVPGYSLLWPKDNMVRID